jgi:hypothetical protein
MYHVKLHVVHFSCIFHKVFFYFFVIFFSNVLSFSSILHYIIMRKRLLSTATRHPPKALLRQRSTSNLFGGNNQSLEIWSSNLQTAEFEIRQQKVHSYDEELDANVNINAASTTNATSSSATLTLFPSLTGLLPAPLTRTLDAGIHPFLPRGYTSGSVPSHYFDYTRWSVTASIASSAAMVLSTQSLLYAVGLGAGSIPTAAALNWVLKDGLGQLGGVLFASMVNNRFDADPKRWRVVAAVALDGAVFLQALTPLAPSLFLPVAALANVGMNVSWLAASASRAGIHLSFSSDRTGTNLADITAKAGSQTTFASTLGMALGVAISPFVGASPELIIPTLLAISGIHLACNYRGLRHVTLNTFNQQRVDQVTNRYVLHNDILSVQNVSKNEIVIGHFGQHLFTGYDASCASFDTTSNVEIVVNSSVDKFINVSTMSTNDMSKFTQHLSMFKYVVMTMKKKEEEDEVKVKVKAKTTTTTTTTTTTVGLLMEESATPRDVLLGYLHAAKLRQLLSIQITEADGQLSKIDALSAEEEAEKWTKSRSDEYMQLLVEKGWNVENLFLEDDVARRVSIATQTVVV